MYVGLCVYVNSAHFGGGASAMASKQPTMPEFLVRTDDVAQQTVQLQTNNSSDNAISSQNSEIPAPIIELLDKASKATSKKYTLTDDNDTRIVLSQTLKKLLVLSPLCFMNNLVLLKIKL